MWMISCRELRLVVRNGALEQDRFSDRRIPWTGYLKNPKSPRSRKRDLAQTGAKLSCRLPFRRRRNRVELILAQSAPHGSLQSMLAERFSATNSRTPSQ